MNTAASAFPALLRSLDLPEPGELHRVAKVYVWGTLGRLVSCHVRLAVPTRRRRCGISAEHSPCSAAVRHQRIPALPGCHGKDRVLAIDACAERPGRGDAQRRRCGARRVQEPLLSGVLPIPRHVRGGLRIGQAHPRLGYDDGGRLRSNLPRGGARAGLLNGR